MTYIKKFITWLQSFNASAPQQEFTKEETDNRLNNITYYYLQLWVNGLNSNYRYMLCEELPSSNVITHLMDVSHQELKDYIQRIYISSHPPKLVVVAL